MKKLWQNNVFYTLVWLAIGTLIIWVVLPKESSGLVKFLLISSPVLSLIAVIIPIVLAVAIIGVISLNRETKEGLQEINQLLGGILKRAPANHVWVTRRALFGSNIDELDKTGQPVGYRAWKAKWGYFIPGYHEDLGFVDLSPQPKDPPAITVNTKDNQIAIIDWRKITYIPDEINAMKFAVKVNGNRDDFENPQVTVVFNQISSQKTQTELTEFEPDELTKMGTDATILFNERMEELDIGIKAKSIEIKKILMPEEIRAAAEYKTVSEKRLEVASIKGQELDTIISVTKADPTKVVMFDMARAALMDLVDPIINAFRTYQETEKEGGEKK